MFERDWRMKKAGLLSIGILFVNCIPAFGAGFNHGELQGPFDTPQAVTKKCLECHEEQAESFMKTAHWNWGKQQTVHGKQQFIGKKNMLNNFCVGVPSNEPRCTSCHAGYGWKDAKFNFKDSANVDCLVCHDKTGTYVKSPAGAGMPDPKVNLVAVAQSVGKSSRKTCGSCHFYGGGGDHIKHGDLDSSMTDPAADIDVHMGGKGMTCTDCHKTKDHQITGESLLVSGGQGSRVSCTDCHKSGPHKNAVLNKHTARVACQTCHIPAIAKTLPTKIWWDWSKAGKDKVPAEKDKFGMETYNKMKGEFRWNRDFAPDYFWFDGTVERYIPGDKITAGKRVDFNSPNGSRENKVSQIFPFKVMRGKQPYDSKNMTVVYPHLFGGYWKHWDWKKAITDGMAIAGLPFSGEFDFVETQMVWKVNHMVSPKSKALKCNDCHGPKGRMNWKDLGYGSDPRSKK